MKILSIDQSTTSTSAFLFDGSAEPLCLFSRPHRQIFPQAGWVEHDPTELIANLREALRLGKEAGAEAWGLANQGESCLAWDAETKEPITPVIVWQDQRSEAACAALEAAGHAPRVRERSGLRLSPYFSASKLAWCLRETPRAQELLEQGRLRLGTTDAFFRDTLTDRFETDVATASRTALLNLQNLTWDPDLCALFGVPIGCLPKITPCSGDLGVADGLPLLSSIVDQQAALFGHAVRLPGETKITVGTGAFALTLTGDTPPSPDSAALPTIAWQEANGPAQYALDGGVFTASSALNWAKDLGLFAAYSELDTLSGPPVYERGLMFVPALSGLGCPHWDSKVKGSWLGLSLGTEARDMVKAIFEGVACRIAEIVLEIETHSPITAPIGLDGGMTRNPWFCQFLADVLQKPLIVSDYAERTALGVAQLAARVWGAEITLSLGETLITPQTDHRAALTRFAAARALTAGWTEA